MGLWFLTFDWSPHFKTRIRYPRNNKRVRKQKNNSDDSDTSNEMYFFKEFWADISNI